MRFGPTTTACYQMRLQCGKAEVRAQRGGLLEGKVPAKANSGWLSSHPNTHQQPIYIGHFICAIKDLLAMVSYLPRRNTRIRGLRVRTKLSIPIKMLKEFQLPINNVRLQLQSCLLPLQLCNSSSESQDNHQ